MPECVYQNEFNYDYFKNKPNGDKSRLLFTYDLIYETKTENVL